MALDWAVVATLASPIIGAAVGATINHFVENRPRVTAFLGHVTGLALPGVIAPGAPTHIGSHSVVIRNSGRKAATNIRLGHNKLTTFQVSPDIAYDVLTQPGRHQEIVFPSLVPKKQITLTYIYFPPTQWGEVNTYLETDDGPIKVLNVLPTVQSPKWMSVAVWALCGVGIVSLLYAAYTLARAWGG